MDYQLVVLRGRSNNQVVKLPEGVTIVGRQQGCQIRIASSQVSRRHCEMFEKKGLLMVNDLGSSNGTFVNGKRIEGRRVLEPGDILSFGKVRFRVEKAGATVPSKPGAARPADTAVAEPALAEAEPALAEVDDTSDSEEFEIDFDDTLTGGAEAPAAAETPATNGAVVAEAEPAPAKAPETPTKDEGSAPEIGEDAVADFLMSIQLDEEDKR